MWRLFVPLRYWRIRYAGRALFNVWVPLVIAILSTLPLLSDAFRTDAMAAQGILSRSGDLLSILTGFFVAALAAVSTFGNPEMDLPIAGSAPPTLSERGGPQLELSRRRFLSYLFGYLAFASIAVYALGFVLVGVQHYLIKAKWPEWDEYTFAGFWFIYALMLANLLTNGLLGLFYLTDRIHRPNRVVSFNKQQAGSDREAA